MARVLLRLPAVLLVMSVVACAGPGLRLPERPDRAPSQPPADLANLPDPVPRNEPRSVLGNPPSYSVLGKTYRVMRSAEGYSATGLASWYGAKFHGRRTSNGEAFDMYKLSAAHRNLPLPSYVRVTNLENGRTTIVRVNDRGPFHSDRLIDLSYAAAVKLGFAGQGTARVRVEVVENTRHYFLQAGAFRDLSAADALTEVIHALTGAPAHVVRVSNDELFRVRIGPVKGRPEALRLQAIITAADHGRPLILEQ